MNRHNLITTRFAYWYKCVFSITQIAECWTDETCTCFWRPFIIYLFMFIYNFIFIYLYLSFWFFFNFRDLCRTINFHNSNSTELWLSAHNRSYYTGDNSKTLQTNIHFCQWSPLCFCFVDIAAMVRGCEVNSGGLELGCNEIDFFGTYVHVCLCDTDACNDASLGAATSAYHINVLLLSFAAIFTLLFINIIWNMSWILYTH